MRLIRVKARDQQTRRELARWGRQHPGVRTVSHIELGFPPDVFAQIPERLLRGGLVDSQPYHPAVSVVARSRGRGSGRVVLPRPAAVVDIPTGGQTAVTTPADEVTVTVDPVDDTPAEDPAPRSEPTSTAAAVGAAPAVDEHVCPERGCGFTSRTLHGLKIHTGRRHRTEESR